MYTHTASAPTTFTTETVVAHCASAAANEFCGSVIALSGDGLRLAMATTFMSGSQCTHVETVYRDSSTSTQWYGLTTLASSDWLSKLPSLPSCPDYFGKSLSFDNAGTTLAIGTNGAPSCVFIYKYNTTTSQFSSDFFSCSTSANYGAAALSGDGHSLWVVSPQDSSCPTAEYGKLGTFLRFTLGTGGLNYAFGSFASSSVCPNPNSTSHSGTGTRLALSHNGSVALYSTPDNGETGIIVTCSQAMSQLPICTLPFNGAPDVVGSVYYGQSLALSSSGSVAVVGALGTIFDGSQEGRAFYYRPAFPLLVDATATQTTSPSITSSPLPPMDSIDPLGGPKGAP